MVDHSEQTPQQTESSTKQSAALIDRRDLIRGGAGVLALCGVGALKFVSSDPLVRPPGGQDESLLMSACIRCQKCVNVCPRKVLYPARIEDGILELRTPTINFESNFCDYCKDENNSVPLCEQVCPTEALKLPEGSTAQNVIMGKAFLNRRECLAYRLTSCRICHDACPYKAMALDENGRPYVLADKCNGCGACEAVCVSLQAGGLATESFERAITVKPTEIFEELTAQQGKGA